MADLFADTDCFVFPYRQIDASGVYFLTKSLNKWTIATRVGIFAEDFQDGAQGDTDRARGSWKRWPSAVARAIVRRSPADVDAPELGLARHRPRHPRGLSAGAEPVPDLRRGHASPRWFVPSPPHSLLLGAALRVGAATAVAPVGFSPTDGYRLVKDWDFARAAARSRMRCGREFATRYIYADGALDHLNDEWSRYRDRDNHVFTPRGLSLVARAAGHAGSRRDRKRHAALALERRVRRVRDPHEGAARDADCGRRSGSIPQDQKWPPEIDVVEIVNNGRDDTRRSFHFLHPTDGGRQTRRARLDRDQTFAPGVDYADGFHVFAVEWTPDRVRHLVDGKPIADRAYRWAHDDGSDGGPAHVLVNLAVGGKWPGPPQRAADFPAALEIEYIRVWQRPARSSADDHRIAHGRRRRLRRPR